MSNSDIEFISKLEGIVHERLKNPERRKLHGEVGCRRNKAHRAESGRGRRGAGACCKLR